MSSVNPTFDPNDGHNGYSIGPSELVRLKVQTYGGGLQVIWVNPDDISRLMEDGDVTLIYLRSEVAGSQEDSSGRVFTVLGPIDKVAARINHTGGVR